MAQALTRSLANGGAGSSTLSFSAFRSDALRSRDVLVRFLAAPINPLDILVLGDLYPIKPQHSVNGNSVIGYDGVGEVVFRGSAVTEVEVGDLVVPSKFGLGTWRTEAAVDVSWVQKIARPNDITVAAITRIGIAPAFFLVEDMCELKPGDWIIQNAATSVIAQMVVQFAKARGIHVISVIRDRNAEEVATITEKLLHLGAEIVVLESDLENNARIKPIPVKLALDSVFGASGRKLIDTLVFGGTYVQLGLLGGPKSQLSLNPMDIFGRNLTLKAFRGTSQMALRTAEEQKGLFDWIISRFNTGELKLPPLGLNKLEWDSSKPDTAKKTLIEAVQRAQQGELGLRKQIILFK
jgi:mitochondrial enoyl-[acyl-carrier protein] reductase / trans-2-enoyl-CoA reductase